jgi:hypothetical protein
MTTLRQLQAFLAGNGHFCALVAFLVVDVVHLVEHGVLALQIFVLGWARPDARGVLGEWIPWLVTSEWMHYSFGLVSLVAITLLRPAFTSRAATLWTVALVGQFWHHLEQFFLLFQKLTGEPWFGQSEPTSLIQLLIPRVELHLFYNAAVAVPLFIALAYHWWPSVAEREEQSCDCQAKLNTARMGLSRALT